MPAIEQPPAAAPALLANTLAAALRDAGTGWSLGVLGAIAEFSHGAAQMPADGALCLRTPAGALCIAAPPPEARLLAWEEPAQDRRLWRQAAALCLPAAEADIGGADRLRCLGPDADAPDPAQRGALLFDTGAGFPHLRACIRTGDPALIALLRAAEGEPILASGGHAAAAAIIAASPPRVFLSRLARLEVYQPIPGAHDRAPEGPHTHVQPALLRHGRPHAATRPLPEGWVSCLEFYPANPLHDILARPTGFDAAAHAGFQALLARFGLPSLLAEKDRLAAALRANASPADYRPAATRHGRAAARVALRQLACLEPDLPALPAWLAALDRAAPATPEALCA